jgi:predicted RNase H-like nuclease (RuvC/YqgF family)
LETKYLWDIIDKLRDELRDMKKENDTLDSSLKECVNEYNKLEKENDYDGLKKKYDYLKLAIVDQNDDIKTLKKDINTLEDLNKRLEEDNTNLINKHNELTDDYNNCSNVAFVEVLNRSNDKLKKENDSLKDEAIKWNRKYNKLTDDYNNDIGASYELDDKHIKIIKDLEEEIKTLKDSSHHPKEYQKESEEYFHHNPQANSLHFFIKDDDDCINEDIDVDDAICTIYKS